jgi:hypothetical protein
MRGQMSQWVIARVLNQPQVSVLLLCMGCQLMMICQTVMMPHSQVDSGAIQLAEGGAAVGPLDKCPHIAVITMIVCVKAVVTITVV